jgi:hypothetical protein
VTKKLPVIGSTAATTAFISARLDGPGQLALHFDGNSKITRENGSFEKPAPNAFSLPAAAVSGIEHCPGSTEACRKACYVGPLEKAQAELYKLYESNAAAMRAILSDAGMTGAWVMQVAGWIKEHAPGGFRWHVSGDVFSAEYAKFIADVCLESQAVDHWIYTRSFDDDKLGELAKVSTLRGGNLAVNLSCDVDNYPQASWAALRHGIAWHETKDQRPVPLRLCYLTIDGYVPIDLPEGSVIFPDYALRPRQYKTMAESEWWRGLEPAQRQMVCPVDAHGKSEKNRCGPCARCLA